MSTLASVIGRGLHSAIPAAGIAGRLYYETDTFTLFRDNGATWDAVEGTGAVADIIDLPTAETDDSLVLAPDGAGGVEFRAEAGGTGSARPWLDTFSDPLDGTYGDDFDGASLNARWTRHNITSGMETYQASDGSHLEVDINSATVDQLYTQDITGLTDFDFVTSMTIFPSLGAQTMYGLFAITSAGAGRGPLVYTDWHAYHGTLSGYTYSNFGGTELWWPAINYWYGIRVWFRLRRVGTTYYTSISRDGINWSAETSAVDAATMDRIAIGRVYGGGTTDRWFIDRFDRVS